MGVWLGRRTEPRVDFREAVRVIWPGEVSGVVARAVNLSSAGILVDAPTPTPCPVGSDVLCDVSPGRAGRACMRGRVAHRRVLPSAKVGMGIEFVDLSPREAAELRDAIQEQESEESDLKSQLPRLQRVKVRFEGTDQVVARARTRARAGCASRRRCRSSRSTRRSTSRSRRASRSAPRGGCRPSRSRPAPTACRAS